MDGLWQKINEALGALIDEYETETVDWFQLRPASSILRTYAEELPFQGNMTHSWETTAGTQTTISVPYETIRRVALELAEFLDSAASSHKSVDFIF